MDSDVEVIIQLCVFKQESRTLTPKLQMQMQLRKPQSIPPQHMTSMGTKNLWGYTRGRKSMSTKAGSHLFALLLIGLPGLWARTLNRAHS
jgi:hypothetical protein